MKEKRGGDFGRSAISWEAVANFLPQLRCPREKESGPTGFLCLSPDCERLEWAQGPQQVGESGDQDM